MVPITLVTSDLRAQINAVPAHVGQFHSEEKSMFQSTLVRRLFAAGALIGGMLVGAAVWAAWSAGGTGSTYARAGQAQLLTTIDVSATTTATLYPGATGTTLIRINNPNTYPVRVTSITGSGAITSDKGAACNASTGVAFIAQPTLTLDVPAGSAATFTLANSVTMSNASDNSCQAAVFTIPVTLTGASNAP